MNKGLLILLLLISINGYCQQKKDTKIIVAISDTTNIFNRISLALYENGFTIKQKDKDVGFIATEDKEMGNLSSLQRIRVLISGNTATFSSEIANNADLTGHIFGVRQIDKTYFPVYFGGMNKSPLRVAWQTMNDIATKFGRPTFSK